MRLSLALLLALVLAGCKPFGASGPDLSITADNYCELSRRRTWSVNDTKETIDEARRENARRERLCGKKG